MVDALGTGGTRALELDVPCPPLEQLLLDRGFISEKQLGSALEEQERSGLPLGQVIIGLGYVTASTIAQALGKQNKPPSAVGPAPTASAPDATLETARTRIAELEMELAPLLVFFRYDDVPGVIGRIGSLFGEARVNIANMAVSRSRRGGKALMALSLDSPPPASLVDDVLAEGFVDDAHFISLA